MNLLICETKRGIGEMKYEICNESPLLSFAIATYNKADVVWELVNLLLSINCEDIEVVVTDDASTDNTYTKLALVNDTRFKIFKNETNLGAINNMVKAVFNASGKYVFYINDRDSINIKHVSHIMECIKEQDYSYVMVKN